MKVHEILTESKTQKAEAPKPRNFVAKNAINTGAGQHKDKKKAAKQGDVKHKTKQYAENVAKGSAINENSDVLAGLTDILKITASRKTPQNPQYFARQVKDIALQLKDNPATQKWARYLDGVVRQADVISSGKEQYSSGFADEVHNVLGPATRAYQDALLNKEGVAEGRIDEKAKSKAQQKFMGMVYAAKKGEKPAGPEVAKAAKGMSKKSAKDYAQTKHKGKPEHVDENATAGATSAANVAVGAIYKNKKPKMQKPGTNALDMKGGNLMTGGSIKR